jgi:hypothetical protein
MYDTLTKQLLIFRAVNFKEIWRVSTSARQSAVRKQFAITFTRQRGITVSVTTLPIAWNYVGSSEVSGHILIANFPVCYWNFSPVNDAESH